MAALCALAFPLTRKLREANHISKDPLRSNCAILRLPSDCFMVALRKAILPIDIYSAIR